MGAPLFLRRKIGARIRSHPDGERGGNGVLQFRHHFSICRASFGAVLKKSAAHCGSDRSSLTMPQMAQGSIDDPGRRSPLFVAGELRPALGHQSASGLGRTWKWKAIGTVPLPPSLSHGARSPLEPSQKIGR